MSDLRSAWGPEEVEGRAAESDESLPEASTTHRFPEEGSAGGADHKPGEEAYEVPATATGTESHRMPPDPPQRPDAAGSDGA